MACVDVDYRDPEAVAGCVTFESWTDARPLDELTARVAEVEPYRPGEFFRREMPGVLAVLDLLDEMPETIVVDGHAWLADGRPGLGAHLHDALDHRAAVVGVAKNPFGEAPERTPGPAANLRRVVPVYRGDSLRPLYVSAVGVTPGEAARAVRSMHGDDRIPTLLRRVDKLCRTSR